MLICTGCPGFQGRRNSSLGTAEVLPVGHRSDCRLFQHQKWNAGWGLQLQALSLAGSRLYFSTLHSQPNRLIPVTEDKEQIYLLAGI